MVSGKMIIGGVMIAALTLAGCSSTPGTDDPSDSAGPFIVYASLGVTGAVAGAASANIAGLNAAAKVINADGGIDGRQIEVVVADDGLDPAKATTLLQEQLDKGAIDLAIPGNTSNICLALIPTLTREGIISSGQQTQCADAEKFPYSFEMFVPNPTQVAGMIEAIEADVHPQKVAVLHANDANGQAVATVYAEQLKDAGIDAVMQEFAPTDVDMTAQLQALETENPDALILQGFGAVAGYTLQSRTKLGWDIPTYGHTDYGTVNLATMSGPADWKNVKVLTFYPMDSSVTRTAGYQQLMDQLDTDGVKVDQALAQYSLFWDLLFLTKEAWESTDSNEPDDLAAAWLALDVEATADSPYVFMPRYKFLEASQAFDLKPGEGTRVVSPGPIVEGVFDSK